MSASARNLGRLGLLATLGIAALVALIEVSVPEVFKRFFPDSPAPAPAPVPVVVTDPSGFRVNYLYLDKASSGLKPIRAGSVLHSGDRYKVDFTPDRDGYVYLFQVDSAGQFFQLFPMVSFKGMAVNQVNPVRAGQRYVFPAVDKSFQLDRTVGRERLYLVTSPAPHRELETLADRLAQARRQHDQTKVNLLNRDLAAQLTGQGSGADGQKLAYRGMGDIVDDEEIRVPWDDSQNPFQVLGQRLENFCDNCVYDVEFEHR